MKAHKLNQRQIRQALYLSRFDFVLKYMTTKSMGRMDSLSRRTDQAKGIKMKKTGVNVLRNNEWQIEDELFLKEIKVYIPKDESLRLEIIWLYYNILVVRHGGQ